MRTIIILLLALLVLILTFISYQERENLFKNDNTIQTGYGISGVGVVPYCKKVWSDTFKRYIMECKKTNAKK